MMTSWLIVFKEIIAVYCENRDISTFCWQNAQVAPDLVVNSDGMYC
jgi:hypothetical protein